MTTDPANVNSAHDVSVPNDRLPYGLLCVFIGVTLINFGAPLLPGGEDQFSKAPNTRIDAAGYAFPIIWSLIFFGMIAFAVRLIRNATDRSPSLGRAIICLMIAGAASIAFVPISIYTTYTLGWIDILIHLVALALAQWFLRRHFRSHGREGRQSSWLYFVPSMYFGWISAATAISTALTLRENGFLIDPELATFVTLAVIGCLTIVGALMIEQRDGAYGLTLAWAFLAIGVEQASFPLIRKAAWVAAATLVVMAATAWCLKRFHFSTSPAIETASETPSSIDQN